MIRHLLKRLFYSLMGRKNHRRNHFSSSDYRRGYNRPPHYPPPGQRNYGHGYYKKKYSSFSS